MYLKFLDHGKGSPHRAAAYVLDNVDHLNNVRAGVEVLAGDPMTFIAACDASPHQWKYTSGVVAWAATDCPTPTQIDEVLKEFEAHAFAGLEPSQYHLFATVHTEDDGSKHLHILVPRLDLQSGKSLNIAPPGHEKFFDPLRDYFNFKYGWARPDDPERAKTTNTPKHLATLNSQAKNVLSDVELSSLKKKQFHFLVDQYLEPFVQFGVLENRKDIKEALLQLPTVKTVKESPKFLAVVLEDGKTHRLRGEFYESEFKVDAFRAHRESEAYCQRNRDQATEFARNAYQDCRERRSKRETYHRKAYGAFNSNEPNGTVKKTNYGSDQLFEQPRSWLDDRGLEQSTELGQSSKDGATVSQNRQRAVEPSISQGVGRSLNRDDSFAKKTNADTISASYGFEKSEVSSYWTGNFSDAHSAAKFLANLADSYQHSNFKRSESGNQMECPSPSSPRGEVKEIKYANGDRHVLEFVARTEQFVGEASQAISRTEQAISRTERTANLANSSLSATDRQGKKIGFAEAIREQFYNLAQRSRPDGNSETSSSRRNYSLNYAVTAATAAIDSSTFGDWEEQQWQFYITERGRINEANQRVKVVCEDLDGANTELNDLIAKLGSSSFALKPLPSEPFAEKLCDYNIGNKLFEHILHWSKEQDASFAKGQGSET